MSKELEEKTTSKCSQEEEEEEEEDIKEISSRPGLEEVWVKPPKRKKSTSTIQMHKKSKEVKPKKNTPKKDADKRVIMMLDKDIKQTIEELKSETKEEQTSLVFGIEQAINK